MKHLRRGRMKLSSVCSMCVCCPLLLLLLWPQLAAGFPLDNVFNSSDILIKALEEVQKEINKNVTLRGLPLPPCNCSGGVISLEAASLEQVPEVLHKLSCSYCLQPLQGLPLLKQKLDDVITLSEDLLRHFFIEDAISCSPPPTKSWNFDNVACSVTCVSCWIKQVELLKSILKAYL